MTLIILGLKHISFKGSFMIYNHNDVHTWTLVLKWQVYRRGVSCGNVKSEKKKKKEEEKI